MTIVYLFLFFYSEGDSETEKMSFDVIRGVNVKKFTNISNKPLIKNQKNDIIDKTDFTALSGSTISGGIQ